MPSYSVSYDLRNPGRNYQPLYDLLNQGGAVRALESLWFVDDFRQAAPVLAAIREVLDHNDGLLLTEITNSNWASHGITPAGVEWLLARFP